MRLFLQLHPEDVKFLSFLKPLLSGHSVRFNAGPVGTVTEVLLRAQEHGAKHIITTHRWLLTKLLRREDDRRQPALDDYAGSIFDNGGYEFLICNPLEHLASTNTGKFLFSRYISKFTQPDSWFPVPAFSWELATPARLDDLYADFSRANLIAQDIETIEDDLAITCSGYCGVWFDAVTKRIRFHSIVIPLKDEYDLAWIRKFNQLPAPKIFQNGKYDNTYFLRWRAPVRNWKFDTLSLFHAFYSELPKRLDFIASFAIRKWIFWKDESENPLHSQAYYRYNAKDSFSTALSFLSLISDLPKWAVQNYLMEFPLIFPCLQAELTGAKRNERSFNTLRDQVESTIDIKVTKLRKALGEPGFNPNSPQQCVRLWKVLGSGDIVSSDVAAKDRVKNRHPLNAYLVSLIEDIRKDRKLISSYFKDRVTLNDRFLYQLNPHGTDTGRLASQEHHFWVGLQIHNIPVKRTDIVYKEVFESDPGFYFGEADYAQAESHDTGYLSGDTNLLTTLASGKDFHAINASTFFGLPYEKIVDANGNVIDKELRDLSKRTNHGANYNMGERILLDTMGIKNVLRARELLSLPKSWTLLQVTKHLLKCFDIAYPTVRNRWYDYIKYQVLTHKMLVGPTGWTRYCFGNPTKSKQDLNSYVAHPPQSLNAMTLNKAWLKVFYEVALPNPADFKLCAQIHDSILFQYRIGRLDLVRRVYECMLFDIPVTDCTGISRVLRVPVDMKGESNIWARIKKLKVD